MVQILHLILQILVEIFNHQDFIHFDNTLSLDAIYDTNLGAVIGMSSEDEYDLFDSGRGATLFEDAKAPFDGSPRNTMWCRSSSWL